MSKSRPKGARRAKYNPSHQDSQTKRFKKKSKEFMARKARAEKPERAP